ncbi:MAG: hypothetical protein ABI039_07430, partial [Vicinamibacterales bacterium]
VSIWLSAGTLVVYGGDTSRIAALPSFTILALLAAAAITIASVAKLRLEHAWPLTLSLVLWLPFLPGSLPPSIVMWEGPIEGVVWLAVAVGLIAARRPAVPALSNPSVAPWLVAAILAVAWVVVFGQVRAVIPNGDEPHYLAATQSLLHDGDLEVANNYEQGEYLEYFNGRLEPHFLKRATSGAIYSIHAPGVSVVVLPAFAIAGYPGAVATMILIAAMTAAMVWRLSFRISNNAGAAWAGTLAVFASAPYFFHAFTIYPEIIGSFCVVCGVSLLVELAEGRDATRWSLFAAGSALALMPWLHSRFAVLAAILGGVIALRLAQRSNAVKNIATFLAVPAVAGVGWFMFFYLIWGSVSPTAPYGADTSTSPAYIVRGLLGLMVDQQFGVLTTAPIYVAAIVGAVPFVRKRPRLAFELLILVLIYTIAVASYAMWWAGAAAPARFLVAILPLAALPIAMLVSGRSNAAHMPVLLLLVISIALLYPRAFVDGGRFIYNNRSGFDATLLWLTSSVDLPSALPSVHGSGGRVAVRDAAIWLAGLAIAVTCVVAVARKWASGARFALTGIVLAITVMTCTRVAWFFDRFSTFELDRSKVATLERLRPAWQTTIVDGATWQSRSVNDVLKSSVFDSYMLSSKGLGKLPAGDYEIGALSQPTPDQMTFSVGRNDPPIEVVAVDSLNPSKPPFRLHLPVTVRNLNLRIDGPAPDTDTDLTIRPVALGDPPTRRAAIRAARYGRARAFFFDEWAYAEPDGFWTRANGTTDVVIDIPNAPPSELPISITAGGVATVVTVTIGRWSETFALDAGQKKDVVLPRAVSGEWPLRIASGAGFRPSEREPGNNDVRALAAWITIR